MFQEKIVISKVLNKTEEANEIGTIDIENMIIIESSLGRVKVHLLSWLNTAMVMFSGNMIENMQSIFLTLLNVT